MEKKNIFLAFLEKFIKLPLWVKEALFMALSDDLNQYSVGQKIVNKNDLFQYYLPTLTYVGKKELSARDKGFAPEVYKFLEGAAQGLNALEITLNNYWTLEEAASANIICIENEYVVAPSSVIANAMLLYCASKIRIGEYFKRIGVINVDQLDAAIRKQKELEAQGQKQGMATVMINLGLVSEEDTKNVLYIKDESKKRFIFNTDLMGKTTTASAIPANEANSQLQDNAKVEKLMKENNLLKNKIRAIIQVIQGQ